MNTTQDRPTLQGRLNEFFGQLIECAALLCVLFCPVFDALAQGSAFTYAGRLNDGPTPANGSYDLVFWLFDAASGGNQIGVNINAGTAVSNGLFTATLNFGQSAFPGADRWLEIGVRTNGAGALTTLTPRQWIASAPYAIQSLSAASATTAANANSVSAANITGALADASLSPNVALLNAGQTFSGSNTFGGVALLTNANNTLAGNGAAITGINAANAGIATNGGTGLGNTLSNLSVVGATMYASNVNFVVTDRSRPSGYVFQDLWGNEIGYLASVHTTNLSDLEVGLIGDGALALIVGTRQSASHIQVGGVGFKGAIEMQDIPLLYPFAPKGYSTPIGFTTRGLFGDGSVFQYNPNIWSQVTDTSKPFGTWELVVSPDFDSTGWSNGGSDNWDPAKISTSNSFHLYGGNLTGAVLPWQTRGYELWITNDVTIDPSGTRDLALNIGGNNSGNAAFAFKPGAQAFELGRFSGRPMEIAGFDGSGNRLYRLDGPNFNAFKNPVHIGDANSQATNSYLNVTGSSGGNAILADGGGNITVAGGGTFVGNASQVSGLTCTNFFYGVPKFVTNALALVSNAVLTAYSDNFMLLGFQLNGASQAAYSNYFTITLSSALSTNRVVPSATIFNADTTTTTNDQNNTAAFGCRFALSSSSNKITISSVGSAPSPSGHYGVAIHVDRF